MNPTSTISTYGVLDLLSAMVRSNCLGFYSEELEKACFGLLAEDHLTDPSNACSLHAIKYLACWIKEQNSNLERSYAKSSEPLVPCMRAID